MLSNACRIDSCIPSLCSPIIACILWSEVVRFTALFETYARRLYTLLSMIIVVIIIFPVLRTIPIVIPVIPMYVPLSLVFLIVFSIVLRVESMPSICILYNFKCSACFLSTLEPVHEIPVWNCARIQTIRLYAPFIPGM